MRLPVAVERAVVYIPERTENLFSLKFILLVMKSFY